ncbi:MAG TPA: AsmA family protein [Alphaproteobacteria bacterium]|nr:AsmA family protein [Alphaproteobacteria bacterium]
MRVLGIIAATLVVLIVAVFLAWDWNWFKPLVERTASHALNRPVTVDKLNASLWDMTLEAEGITVGNPPEFPEGTRTGTIDKIMVTLDPKEAIRGHLRIPSLIIDRPIGDLGRNPKGVANWTLTSSGEKPPEEDQKVQEPKGAPPLLGSVIIHDGHIHIVDPKLKSDFKIDVDTDESKPEPEIVLNADGTYVGQRIRMAFRGGSLLSLRDPSKPYPIDFTADHGQTHVAIKGRVQDPWAFGGANVQLSLKGNDLSELKNLTTVPLPQTQPYSLEGHLDYQKGRIRFTNFVGRVGDSDLSGQFAVEPGKERPLITADMKSKTVDMADLSGFIGGEPGKEAQRPRLFPDNRFNLEALQKNDYDIKYTADSIKDKNIPIDGLDTHLVIKNGVARLEPINFKIGEGKLGGRVSLDASSTPPRANINVDVSRVDLRRLVKETPVEGAGLIGGHVALDGVGNSTAEIMGDANGDLKLFMTGGDISALLVDLAGLDFGNSLMSALGLPRRAVLRCMVSDFEVKDGLATTQLFIVDTTEANIIPAGTINFDTEQIDFRMETEKKKPSVGSVSTPIRVTGPLKKPSIAPEYGPLGARAGAAALLGALLTPLGALIPTIQLGLGENNDCNALVQSVGADAGKATPSDTGRGPSGKNGDNGGDKNGGKGNAPAAAKPTAPRNQPAPPSAQPQAPQR